jgi:uncharacterized protein involved in exopolysaccharide biosynthesis
MLLVSVIMLLTPNVYRSNATILPSGSVDQLGGLKSLAGLTGMLPTDENSSQLFPVVLQSRAVRDAVLDATYSFSHDGEQKVMSLSEYFDTKDPDELRLQLGRATSISVSKQTGVIELMVETENAGLSQAVAAQYLKELEYHNLHRRRSEARERVDYLSRELPHRTEELQAAEDALSAFRQNNSNWAATTDPELLKLLGRLERDVSTKERTVSYLSQELEAARLDAQKDIPVVRVLDQPVVPTQKAGPRRTLTVLVTGMIVMMLSVALVLAFELMIKPKTTSGRRQYEAFQNNLSGAFPRVRRLAKRLQETTAVSV